MEPNRTIDETKPIEAVVGIFESAEDASRVAASLRGPDMKMQRVSRRDPAVADEMPDIVYDEIDHVEGDEVSKGILRGGAIGAGSGLLLLGVPGLNIAAPIAGALAGAWIGGVAGIDEANRAVELPNESDYRDMLAKGKSFIVIAGTESERQAHEKQMRELGAMEIHQHPPLGQVVHESKQDSDES